MEKINKMEIPKIQMKYANNSLTVFKLKSIYWNWAIQVVISRINRRDKF